MKYEKASELAPKIRALCGENAIPAPLETTSDREPSPDAEATIQCPIKIREEGYFSDSCKFVKGSDCPRDISLRALWDLDPKD